MADLNRPDALMHFVKEHNAKVHLALVLRDSFDDPSITFDDRIRFFKEALKVWEQEPHKQLELKNLYPELASKI